MRTWLIVIALALVACLVAIGWRPASQGPAFEVRVERSAGTRPLFGLFGIGGGSDVSFTHASPGAAVGVVGRDRLELRAEGWDLSLEIDSDGRVDPGTRLVFPSWMERGGKPVTMRCRPADRAIGYLRITTPEDAGESSGRFLVELPRCEYVESGQPRDYPVFPLTVHGSFDRIPHRAG